MLPNPSPQAFAYPFPGYAKAVEVRITVPRGLA